MKEALGPVLFPSSLCNSRLANAELRGRCPPELRPGTAASLCRAAVPARGSRAEPGRWRCLASCQRLLRSFAVILLPHGRHFRALAAVAEPAGALPPRLCRAVLCRKRCLPGQTEAPLRLSAASFLLSLRKRCMSFSLCAVETEEGLLAVLCPGGHKGGLLRAAPVSFITHVSRLRGLCTKHHPIAAFHAY